MNLWGTKEGNWSCLTCDVITFSPHQLFDKSLLVTKWTFPKVKHLMAFFPTVKCWGAWGKQFRFKRMAFSSLRCSIWPLYLKETEAQWKLRHEFVRMKEKSETEQMCCSSFCPKRDSRCKSWPEILHSAHPVKLTVAWQHVGCIENITGKSLDILMSILSWVAGCWECALCRLAAVDLRPHPLQG